MITILQIGFGPLGIQTANFIAQKENVKTVAGVDINDALNRVSMNHVDGNLPDFVYIFKSVNDAINYLEVKPDIAIITTVSSLEKLIPQVEQVAQFGISVISTCEELSYPWKN